MGRKVSRKFGEQYSRIGASSIRKSVVRIAKSIITYFADNSNRLLIGALRQAGVQMVAEAKAQLSETLSGKTFVITGTLSHPRDDFKALIEQHGGKVSSAVSAQTDYLLAGDKGGSKLQKAKKLGIKIIGEEEFGQLLKVVESY